MVAGGLRWGYVRGGRQAGGRSPVNVGLLCGSAGGSSVGAELLARSGSPWTVRGQRRRPAGGDRCGEVVGLPRRARRSTRGATMPTDGLVADLWGEAPRSRWCSCTSRSCARCSRGRGYDAARGRGRGGRSAFSRASSSPAGQETLWRYGAGHVLPTWPSSRSRRRRSGVLRSCASRRSSGRRRGHRGGRHREVLAELDALVGGEPLRGRLQAQRMLVVYRSGRQADALDAYRAARAGRWSRRSALSPGRSAAACTSDPATGSGARPVGRRRCPPSAGDLRRRAGLRPARRDRRRGAPGRSGGPGCGARRAASRRGRPRREGRRPCRSRASAAGRSIRPAAMLSCARSCGSRRSSPRTPPTSSGASGSWRRWSGGRRAHR